MTPNLKALCLGAQVYTIAWPDTGRMPVVLLVLSYGLQLIEALAHEVCLIL